MATDRDGPDDVGGTNASERYLAGLCRRTFLRLWSYPNVHRKRRNRSKEVCDVLVVFGTDIIVFSDKEVTFTDAELAIAWDRWKRGAIDESVDAALGAGRQIRNGTPLYIDKRCTVPLPIELPRSEQMRIHLIAVAVGASAHAAKHWQGPHAANQWHGTLRTSLLLHSWHNQDIAAKLPFSVVHGRPGKFVHVLDDFSLDMLLLHLDTPADLLGYLRFRENLLTWKVPVMSSGDDDLLGMYLSKARRNHDPMLDMEEMVGDRQVSLLSLDGGWNSYRASNAYQAAQRARQDSEPFNRLMGQFVEQVAERRPGIEMYGALADQERTVRYMACEALADRAMIGQQFVQKIKGTYSQARSSLMMPSRRTPGLAYILLLLPMQRFAAELRTDVVKLYAEAYALVTRRDNPNFTSVILFVVDRATNRTELYSYEFPDWSEDHATRATELQQDLKILLKTEKKDLGAPPSAASGTNRPSSVNAQRNKQKRARKEARKRNRPRKK